MKVNSGQFKKGQIPHNKNTILLQQTRDKISQNNARYWLGKKMPKEAVEKVRQSKLGKKRKITWGDSLSKALKGHRGWNKDMKHTQKTKEQISEGVLKVHSRIMKEVIEYEKLGYRCVPTGGKVRPDFIAVKDNKIIAVEVEYGRPNYQKYDEEMLSRVDDVVWIIRKKETSTTMIRTPQGDGIV